MHASCTICGDIFTGVHPEVVHSTNCGHIFHYDCLMEWLQRSKTCPHCRAKVNQNNIIRLYFQLSAGVSEDTGTLENKIQSLTFQLAIKNTDFKKISEETVKYKEQNKGLRAIVLESEEKIRNNETVVSSLQDQVKVLKVQIKSLKQSHSKVEKLEMKLEQYKNLEKILKGSVPESAESLELIKDITDTTMLCACINSLKREISALTEKSRSLQGKLKSKESKIIQMESDVLHLQEQLSFLNHAFNKVHDDLSATEAENRILKRKFDNEGKSCNPNESPGSYSGIKDKIIRNLISENQTPRLSENLLDIKKSIQVNCLKENAITPIPVKSKFLTSERRYKMLLNKPRVQQSRSFFELAEDCSSNGLGGHSQGDDFNRDKNSSLFFTDTKSFKPPYKKTKFMPTSELKKNPIPSFFMKKDSN